MNKKIVIVGGVAGGASAAARIRRLDSSADIVMFERGAHVSFSNCSLPYYIGGDIHDSDRLLMMTPEKFKSRYNIQVRVKSEVISIDRQGKCVLVRELETNREYTESYDKLILAPGASAVKPKSIKGIEGKNVFTVRDVTDICALKDYVEKNNAQNIVIAGGGFVGIEMAENFVKAGKNVSIIEGADQILTPFDYDMAQLLHKELCDRGVHLYLGSMVYQITEHSVKAVKDGEEIELRAEAVLLCVGIRPETDLAQAAGLTIGKTRAIQVNHNYQTNDPDIYAVGDAVEVFNRMARTYGRFAQAGPAQKQARAAADHICGLYHINNGCITTFCLRVFGQNAACTGMNESAVQNAGIPYDVAYVLPYDIVSIMPDAGYMAFKLIFEVPTGRILGAQAIGEGNVTRRIDVIATILTMDGTLEDLKELELCYSPVYGTAKDVVNMAALVGLNLLHNRFKQVRVHEVRALVENGAYIIDVREENEYTGGHLIGSHNIPLSQLRERMDEIPRDVPIYLHCRTGQRSYYALCELMGNGYTNAINISGSFLGICLNEYFNDSSKSRTSIVTAYCFE